MKEKVSEIQDHAFYRVGSLGLMFVVFSTILIWFAWFMQKPIENQANDFTVGIDRVPGIEKGR